MHKPSGTTKWKAEGCLQIVDGKSTPLRRIGYFALAQGATHIGVISAQRVVLSGTYNTYMAGLSLYAWITPV